MNEHIEPLKITCLGRYADVPLRPGSKETLIQRLIGNGISEAQTLQDSAIAVFCEYLKKDLQLLKKMEFPVEKRVLLMLEPEVVIPSRFGKKFSKEFGTILRIGRPPKSTIGGIHWPQFWRELPELETPREAHSVVMMAGNKISFIPGELYGLRRNCAYELPELVLFGSGWDTNTLTRFRKMVIEFFIAIRSRYAPRAHSMQFWFRKNSKWLGAPIDKQNTLKKYRYSLVIENSTEFLSEKLFDAFFAGCIPIYIGPNVKDYGIPDSLVVSVDPDLSSIKRGILEAKKIDYTSWYEELVMWLGDSQTRNTWSAESYFAQLSESLLKIHKTP
jgi:hypothetical protein